MGNSLSTMPENNVQLLMMTILRILSSSCFVQSEVAIKVVVVFTDASLELFCELFHIIVAILF